MTACPTISLLIETKPMPGSFFDTNGVAGGLRHAWSEDLQDGAVLGDGLHVENSFRQ